VDILVGAFMVLKRELYNEIGGFDENCFMYSDDIDLSYMALQRGKENYYFHETSVIHYKGESTVRDGTYMKRFQEAMNFFYKKHFSKSLLFDVFMRIGAFAFSLLKKKQQKNKELLIDKYVVFTHKDLKINTTQSVDYFAEFEFFKNDSKLNYELVFDTTSFSNKAIIAFMEQNQSKNTTFKNYIYASNFRIGSNNANDIGKIIFCEN
jgi:hypothetical protein